MRNRIRTIVQRRAASAGMPFSLWVVGTSAALVAVGVPLGLDGGDLPLAVQVVAAAALVVPWTPAGYRMRTDGPAFVVLVVAPVAALVFTGAHAGIAAVWVLAAARVAVMGQPAASVVFAAGLATLSVVASLGHGSTQWYLWPSYIVTALAVGLVLRAQRLLLLTTQDATVERARLAALEERRRIARDIHDTLAHSLTVMLVHVNSARLQLASDPAAAAASLDELRAVGRASLDEVRRSVGLLSSSPDVTEPVDPTSAASAVQELAGTFRRAGVDVDVRLDVGMAHVGLLADAPAAVWGTAYRVVQEGLANATRHAPGAPVAIVVAIDDAGLRVEVTNPLPQRVRPLDLPGGGHGLSGMGERVRATGGTVTAGPEGSSWVVRARIPLRAAIAVDARRDRVFGRVS